MKRSIKFISFSHFTIIKRLSTENMQPKLAADNQMAVSREERVKQLQQRYDKYEQQIKQDKDMEIVVLLSELAREIEDISSGNLVDQVHTQILFGIYLPKFFKLLLQRKYFYTEIDKQIQVTQFINLWMKYRVPHLKNLNNGLSTGKKGDPVYAEIGFWKELEILEMIFNSDNEIYNFRVSKNSPDVEERLFRIYESLGSPIESVTGKNALTNDVVIQGENQGSSIPTDGENDQQVESNQPIQPNTFQLEVAKVKRQQFTSYFFVHNINVFSKFQGFEGLLHLISEGHQLTKGANHQTSMLKVCLSVMTMISQMKCYFIDSFWVKDQAYGEKIANACYQSVLQHCTIEDLRIASKKDILYFSNNVESILDSVTNGLTPEEKTERVYKLSETIELELALKCLRVPVLEKKLIGHQILISQIQKVRVNSKQRQNQPLRQGALALNIQGLVIKRWLTVELLLQWFDQHRIFDLVFGDSLHSEVIKKSYTLLDFLYQNGRIQRKELDKMWECATKKHEAYKVAILKALSFLATKAKIEDLKYLFLKIKSIPMVEVDKFCLDLVKSIAKKLAGEEQLVGSPKRNQMNRMQPLIGPSLPPHLLQRSNSGDRQVNKNQKQWKLAGDDRLNNSFSNGMNEPSSVTEEIKMMNKNSLSTPFDGVETSKGLTKEGKENIFDTDDLNKHSLDKVALNRKGLNQMKRNKSSPRAGESAYPLDNDLQFKNFKQDLERATKVQQSNQRNQIQDPINIGRINQNGYFDNAMNQDLNPLEVPPDREDKRTADEDISFNDSTNQNGAGMNDIFNNSLRDDNVSNQQTKKKNALDLEEEKGGNDPFGSGNKAALLLNVNELIRDQSLGIDDLEKRDLAHQILDYLWILCQEVSVSQHDLSMQAHKQAIEDLSHLITHNYPKAVLSFIGRCVGCLLVHQSAMSMHVILQKLIMNYHFSSDNKKALPNNRLELISALDQELNMTNVCLSSYIEFKRLSLNHIFDQMGSQEHEQENLETQSSLDNDDERSTSTAGNATHANQQNLIGRSGQQVNAQDNERSAMIITSGTPSKVHESANQKDLIHIQDDDLTKNSSGSMFVSPRMRVEEEFKIQKSVRTQSFREDGISNMQYQKGNINEFASLNTPKEEEMFIQPEQLQPSIGIGLMQTQSAPFATGNARHMNSQSKRNNALSSALRNDQSIQQNLAANQFRRDQNESQLQHGQPIQQQQQQPSQHPPNQVNMNRDFLNSLITNEVYKYSYYEELHLRLDFLKFLVGSCPSILKAQQLQILWECLVINAFYEKERDQFFNWCTQILKASQSLPSNQNSRQGQNQIVASDTIFNDDCLEMLFFDTLLKLDFRYITEVMYDCFERYFIYINEQYGQIVINSTFDSAFEVFETKLIGVEALWEILLCSRNTKVYKQATEFLHKIYKKMSPSLVERLNEIKEDLLQTCMEQIKTGYNEIRAEIGGNEHLFEVPIYQFSQSFEDPKNRIARSISQLCKFIDQFEGLRDKSAKSQLASSERDILVIGNNQIGNSTPKKIQLTRPISTKIGQIREEFSNALFPKRQPKEVSLMHKGKELNEDLKTLKDLGLGANDNQIQIFISLRSQFELDMETAKDDLNQNDQVVNEMVEQLKMFMEDIQLSDAVLKLAVKKCNLNLDETFLMLTDEEKVNDLQEEVRRNEEAASNNNIVMIEEVKDETIQLDESKLNLIISNRSEYFDLLFELLNLGINEITNAAWNLLAQIPVNKTLLQQIRTLSIISEGSQANWCQIIDPTNTYKMLYSIQIVNSLISVNNEKLSEAEIQERYEWRLRFLELGGFEHLYSILITSEPEEFLTSSQHAQRPIGNTGKKKGKGNQLGQGRRPPEIHEQPENKESQQIQNNQAKCLGYLISIVKIFIQAALLTVDEDKLLTLIVQSSTSPFRKPKTMKSALQSVPQSKFNQIMFGGAVTGGNQGAFASSDDSRGNSSINTPKFQSSHSSTPHSPKSVDKEKMDQGGPNSQMNKSTDTVKADTVLSHNTFGVQGNENQLYTQVDDFPRLVEQINGPIAQNLLDKVINFNGLISKLLNIIYKAVMFCESPEVSSLVQNSLDLLLPCIVWQPQLLLKEIYDFVNLESLLIRTLMQNSNENVRRSIERTFKIICNENLDIKNQYSQTEVALLDENQQQLMIHPKVYILRILLKNLPDVETKSDFCEEFFNLLTHLMKQCQSNFKLQATPSVLDEQTDLFRVEAMSSIQLKQNFILDDGSFSALSLLQWCIYQLKCRPTYEDRYNQYADKVLAGYLQLTQSVLEINHQLKELTHSGKGGYNLIKTVFDFLFLLPSMEDQQSKHQRMISSQNAVASDSHPKCKRKATRKKAFNLLLTLCQNQEQNFVQLLQELYTFHSQIQKSQKVVNLAEFDNEVGMRSAAGYVGLKNFGCTCYMNALMQQLFMMPDFRKGILESDVNDPDFENNVLYQLKLIFANLQESEKQYYAPLGFTKAFKFWGEPVNVRVQQDSFEFFSLLCDNIESILKGTPYENYLKESIGGLIGNETMSMEEEYPYVGEREETFFAISLDIKNKKSLAEALDLYIKPDHLEGDNKYDCEKYNRKIDAQRRSYLKSLSNTVIINLKRFEFDYNSMQRFKVNDYCEFPERINFKPWTSEGIKERERLQKKKAKAGGAGEVQNPNEELKREDVSGEDDLYLVEGEEPEFAEDAEEAVYEDGSVAEEESHTHSKKPSKRKNKQKEAAPIDEDLDSNAADEPMMVMSEEGEGEEEDEENMHSMMNTGKYFDEGVMEDFIDIPADEEDDGLNKKVVIKTQGRAQKPIQSSEKQQLMEKIQKSGATNAVSVSKKRKATQITNQMKKMRSSKDDSYYEFELVGVLVHSGSADAGHYYSFIKERQPINGGACRWLEFNDTYVREFDLKNIGIECFGGDQNQYQNTGAGRGLLDDFSPADARLFERCRNAYLLIYQRVEPISQANHVKASSTQMSKKLINGIEEPVYQRIWDENAAFMKLKLFFDQEYFTFARDYINLYNFENVLFFGSEESMNYRLEKLIVLTQKYLESLDTEQDGHLLKQNFLLEQQKIDSESKLHQDSDIFNSQTLRESITKDPGLHALKLATILSQDIITKVKDVQSFVQWMQLLDQIYARHAVACVWLIKYLTENQQIVVELLIESQYFEVRESFAKLLMTAIGVTAKNEEAYMFKSDDILYISTDQQSNTINRKTISRSAVVRFMEVFFNDTMLDKVLRNNWRRFDEYFQVLASTVQIGFAMAKYMIVEQNAVIRLLEFVMNTLAPFQSNKIKMGDRMQQPNFTQVVDVISILIRSCFTQGIKQVRQYSPESLYQREDQHIELPFDTHVNQFPLLTTDCFTYDLILKANPNNDSLQRMVVHLSWGDMETSHFFINQLVTAIQGRRTSEDLAYHMKILTSLLLMNDEFQQMRLNEIFRFDSASENTFQGSTLQDTISTSVDQSSYFQKSKSFFKFLENQRVSYPTYVLRLLQFFGKIAILQDPNHTVLNFLRSNTHHYQEWVQQFLLQLNLQYKNNKNNTGNSIADSIMSELIASCIDLYKQVFDLESAIRDQDELIAIAAQQVGNPIGQEQNNRGENVLFDADDDFITGNFVQNDAKDEEGNKDPLEGQGFSPNDQQSF